MSSGQYLSACCKKKNLERILEYALKIQKGQLDLGSVNWVILMSFFPPLKKKKNGVSIFLQLLYVDSSMWTGQAKEFSVRKASSIL